MQVWASVGAFFETDLAAEMNMVRLNVMSVFQIVTVTVLMPGATDTNFFHRAGADDTKLGQSEKDDPAEVAKEGFEALMAGKDHVIAGSLKNKFQAAAGYIPPDRLVAKAHAAVAAPGSGKKKYLSRLTTSRHSHVSSKDPPTNILPHSASCFSSQDAVFFPWFWVGLLALLGPLSQICEVGLPARSRITGRVACDAERNFYRFALSPLCSR
jgi:hypothetical protein